MTASSGWAVAGALALLACGGRTTSDASPAAGGATDRDSSPSAAGSGGGGGAMGGTPECTGASECRLFQGCSQCVALGPHEDDPPHALDECLESLCGALDIHEPACIAGQCVAGFECDAKRATCKASPPSCEVGSVPSIHKGCWGPCVPATECRSVTSCTDCAGSTETCVRSQSASGSAHHCVSAPEACVTGSSCACMGGAVCVAPYDTCTDFTGSDGMSCS